MAFDGMLLHIGFDGLSGPEATEVSLAGYLVAAAYNLVRVARLMRIAAAT